LIGQTIVLPARCRRSSLDLTASGPAAAVVAGRYPTDKCRNENA
jgi:hypothetical protein